MLNHISIRTFPVRAMLALFCLLPLGCVARVGAEGVSVPPDSAQICEGHCQSIGMHLSAVAIMANNVGCVCQAADKTETSSVSSQAAPPAAGMATIMLQEAARQQQQQSAQARAY